MVKRPVVKEGNLAKLENLVQKIKIVTHPEDFKEEDVKFKALVRIRIPLEEIKESDKPKDEGESEEGEEDGEATPQKQNDASNITEPQNQTRNPEFSKDTIKAQEIPDGEEKKWKEVDTKDEVLMLRCQGEEYSIYVFHQAATRAYRKEIANQLKRLNQYFADVNPKVLQKEAEVLADKAENLWIEHHAKNLPKFDFPLN